MRRLIAPDKIVRFLLEVGEANKYEIAKGAHLSYSRIHESIPKLMKTNLIKSRETGKSRAGLIVIAYRLTLKGLAAALQDNPEGWKRIDDVASKHMVLLPLIFDKLDYFIKTGHRNFIVRRLRDALEICADVSYLGIEPDLISVELLPPGKNLENRITRFVLIPDPQSIPPNWENAIAGDQKLMNYVMPILEMERKLHAQLSILREKQLKIVQKASKQASRSSITRRRKKGPKRRR